MPAPQKIVQKPVVAPAAMPGVPDEIVRRGDYLRRDEALALLRIKPQTLYCYVSRGWIRSVPQSDGRSSYYAREDVERVRSRSAARGGRAAAAESSMRGGEPVITTRITEITRAGPRYRAHLAVDLARGRVPFENVAEYLWGEPLEESPPILWRHEAEPAGMPPLLRAGARLRRGSHVLQLMSLAVTALGMAEGPRRERVRAGSTPTDGARRIVRILAGTFGFLGPTRRFVRLAADQPLVSGLAAALGLRFGVEQRAALNAALVLAADHELNPATFAARVAASGSADLHSCVGAALNTHYGTLVGRTCDRLERVFRPGASTDQIVERAHALMDAARMLPGFNHHLYPQGDPRARQMIELALMLGGGRPEVRDLIAALNRVEEELDARPAIECGLVVLCRALALPDHAAAGLYALGRTAGWAAHVFEQRLAGFVIRPRAKFEGEGSSG